MPVEIQQMIIRTEVQSKNEKSKKGSSLDAYPSDKTDYSKIASKVIQNIKRQKER